jgi:predicted metal-binding membrane protein
MSQARVLRERAARALRWRPEWIVVVVVAGVWIALAAGYGSHPESANGRHVAHGDHWLHDHGEAVGTSSGVIAALPAWALMSIAMMTPATLPAVRHVGFNSVRRRRQWAMALYVGAYSTVWLAFGLVALAAAQLARTTLGLEDTVLLALALGVAAGWQLTRWKRRAIYACRRTVPLPPRWPRAELGCMRFALRQGLRGVESCWALMAVMAVVGHSSIVLMVALTALVVVEEQTFVGRRLLSPSAAAFALAAGVVLVA